MKKKKKDKPVEESAEKGRKTKVEEEKLEKAPETPVPTVSSSMQSGSWTIFKRINKVLPEPPKEIKPHPHGVELGVLIQMLKDSSARTLRSMLCQDFSRVGGGAANQICNLAKLNPKANPTRIAHQESEALFKAINETKLMRPPTDCLSPIGEEAIMAGLKKEIAADFYTAVTRGPEVYRGNPFQIEAGLAYVKPACAKRSGEDRPGENADLNGARSAMNAEDPVRVLRFANKVPLLCMGGACAITKAITGVNWKSYGLSQPRGSLPVGPLIVMVHMASVWVPFTSESKEAIAHYPEIIREITFALQECGRRLDVYLSRRRRQAELERKKNYIVMYLPHLALGLRQILDLDERQEKTIVSKLHRMLERTHLE